MRECEHIKLIFSNQATLTCQICQETAEVQVNDTGTVMKKTFTIVSVSETNRNSRARRWVVAEILQKEEPESMDSGKPKYLTFTVRYPAWGPNEHYTTSLTLHPGDKNLPHSESMEIAKQLKIFMGLNR